MEKKKKKVMVRWIILLILVIISILVTRDIIKYHSHIEILSSPIHIELSDALSLYDSENITKQDFSVFLSSKDRFRDLKAKLGEIEYRVIVNKNGIVKVYDIGFDGIDDSLKQVYTIKDMSYIKSKYISGDILLYSYDYDSHSHKTEPNHESDIAPPKDTLNYPSTPKN